MSSLTSSPALASTQEFIEDNPIDVVLIRTAKVPSGAGGWVEGEVRHLLPQRMRLVSQSQLQSSSSTRVEGDVAAPEWVLVGMPDVDMKKGDTFILNNQSFRVHSISVSPPWAIRGRVVEND